MKISTFNEANSLARDRALEFRATVPASGIGLIDERFHQHKNRFPYFGFIDVQVEDVEFVMFSGNDDLIAMTYFWYGPSSFERMSLKIWSERCANVGNVYDIGAFSGIYSLVAAARTKTAKIWAFEPVRRTYGRLLLNTQSNSFVKQITTVNKAISNAEGKLTIYQFRGENILGNGASLLQKDNIPVTASDETVDTISIDKFREGKPQAIDLVKIDVEGAEIMALQGMEQVLSDYGPDMVIEVTAKTAAEVRALLLRHGYTIQRIEESAMRVVPFDGNVKGVCNLLAEKR